MKDLETLDEARDYVRRHVGTTGVACPCCGKLCKVVNRTFSSIMAYTLIWLVREYERTGRWVHVNTAAPKAIVASNEVSRMIHWGLVMPLPNKVDEDKRTSGYWAPTQAGIDFVYQRSVVTKTLSIFNNQVISRSQATLTIRGALKNKFSYAELMSKGVERCQRLN